MNPAWPLIRGIISFAGIAVMFWAGAPMLNAPGDLIVGLWFAVAIVIAWLNVGIGVGQFRQAIWRYRDLREDGRRERGR